MLTTVLGVDPGTKNFALSVITIKNNKVKMLGSMMHPNPINNLTSGNKKQVSYFLDTIDELLEDFDIEAVCSERFLVRGFGTASIELVSNMNGLLQGYLLQDNIPVSYVTSAQWKNDFNRRFGGTKEHKPLEDLYYAAKKQGLPPHRIDATLIAIYHAKGSFATITKEELLIESFKRSL